MRKLILIAMTALCAMVRAATTGDYLQDDLIACWDAYENNGAGGHSATLDRWTDTSGRYSFVFHANSGITVGAASLGFSGASGCYAELTAADTAATFDLAKDGTLEVVFRGASDQSATCHVLHSSPASGIAVGSYTTQTKWIVATGKNSPCPVFDAREGITTLALHYNGGYARDPHVDGETVSTSGSGEWSGVSGQSTTTLGARANKNTPFKGEICAIRLYSTQLTEEQMAANRAVDVTRFIEGDFSGKPGIDVQGFPENYSAGNLPVYGHIEQTVGDAVELTAPEYVEQSADVRVYCSGWKLYDNSETTDLIAESTEATRRVCAFTYEKPVRLVWQWETCHLITATAGPGLTVTPASAWGGVSLPAVFTVSGTDHPYWTGDGIDDRYAKTVEVRSAVSATVSVSGGRTIAVPVDFGTIEAALADAHPGDTIELAPGDYTLASADGIVVPTGVMLKGTGADPSGTTVAAAEGAGSASLVTVTGGKLENLTFTGSRCMDDKTVPRILSASEGAFVTNCVFTGHATVTRGNLVLVTGEGTHVVDTTFSDAVQSDGVASKGGVGIEIRDRAIVSDVLIDDVDILVGQRAAAVLLTGGARLLRSTVRNCDVSSMAGFLGRAGGVCIDADGEGCLVEDCVIEGNSIGTDEGGTKPRQGAGGLAVLAAATVRRTVIRNNASTDALAGGVYCTGAAMFENCLVAGNRAAAPVEGAEFCGGLYAKNPSAVLRHVTVAGNRLETDFASHKSHGCYLNGARAINCIFGSNGNGKRNLLVEGASGCATFCLAPTLAECLNASNATSGENCLAGEPLFTNAAAGDYTLTAASAALDVGTDELGIGEDIRGVERPKNAGYDLGAYECEYEPTYECSIQPLAKLLGPSGGTVPFIASASMATLVSAYEWTVTAASGDAPVGGVERTFAPVFPAGVNTYAVSLKVKWSDGHEATAPESAVVRVVGALDVAPGDDLVSVLGSLTELSADNPVTVNLSAGTYTAENSGVADDAGWMFTLEEGVILKGAGAGRTILDGGLTNRVLRLKPGSRAQDLTVANAQSKAFVDSLRGYALDVNGATVENCVVTNGLATEIRIPVIREHCVFLGNGGTLANVQVCGTTVKPMGTGSQGGVVYVSSGLMTNCQVFANSSRDKVCSSLTLDGATAQAVDCDIFGNTAVNVEGRSAVSGGASILGGGGKLVCCRVTGNTNEGSSGNSYAGGLCAAGGNALVDRCIITNNASGFVANHTTAGAGGVLISGSATLRNTLVAGNRLTGVKSTNLGIVGGGVLVTTAAASVENCTIADNVLDGACCESAGVHLTGASSVVNCIIWNNGGTPTGGEWMLGNVSNTAATVTYTCTMPLAEGAGNIAEDPKLKVNKGYLVKSSSPCVNAGDPTGWTEDDVDLVGNPRLRKDKIDMGCYENICKGLQVIIR